jgi:hypothetical protein
MTKNERLPSVVISWLSIKASRLLFAGMGGLAVLPLIANDNSESTASIDCLVSERI